MKTIPFILMLHAFAGIAPLYAGAPDRTDVLDWIAAGPAFDAPAPGSVLGEDDAAIAQFLPPGYAEEFRFAGVRLTIDPRLDFFPHPVYREATARHLGEAQLGADGRLEHYQAGRPFDPAGFTDLSAEDAGYQVAWNFIHRWQYYGWQLKELSMNYLRPGADSSPGRPGLRGGGHLERFVTQNYHRVYLSHLAMFPSDHYRVDVEGSDRYLFKDYMEFLEPFDVKGTQFVLERALDPTEPDQVNSYLPGERRVRRLSAEERADRFMGADLTMDDFEGFSGQVLDYAWRYLGQRRVLAVVDAGGPLVEFFGPQSRVPDDRWQLRDTHAVEIVPKWAGHPYASKILFIDAQTWNVTVALAFNRDQQMWRILSPLYHMPEPASDPEGALETSVPRWTGTIAIDRIADTATISRAEDPTRVPTMKASQIRRRFNVSNLTSGR